MTFHQLHLQAESEWSDSLTLRQKYPTFSFYWYERYERIYNIPAHLKNLFRKYHGKTESGRNNTAPGSIH